MNLQWAANQAVLDGLAAYERRHGWKGHLENVLLKGQTLTSYRHPDWDDPPAIGRYTYGLVTSVSAATTTIKIGNSSATLAQADAAWTQKPVGKLLTPGDVVYVKVLSLGENGPGKVALEQDSGAQGALLAVDNATGEVRAMVGGRDFNV